MRKEFLLVLVLVLGGSGTLLAQGEKTGLEFGAYVSQQNWKARDFQVGPPQSAKPFSLGFDYDDHVAYGLRANFLSQGHWGGEISYSYQKNTVTLTRQSFAPVALRGGIHHVFYNEVFYPVRYGGAVTPFVTAGLGLAGYQLSDASLQRAADPADYGIGTLKSMDNRFAFNYGVGVKANIGPHFGIRADARHIFSDVPSYGLPKQSSNPLQVVLPGEGKLQTYEFSVGIYFRKLVEGFR